METGAAKLLYAMSPWSSKLGRAPVVAEPCVGISAYREWMQKAGLVYRPCAAYDFNMDLVPFWRALRNQGLQGTSEVKLGLQEGDIERNVVLSKLSSAEGLISGPPCQPFASTGLRQGAQDEKGRTDVFESVVSMICEEGSRGCLLFFILENSSHLADANHAEFLNEMLLRLEVSLPYFLVDTVKKDAAEFLPVKRGRFFIRGLRRDCLPDPMQAFLPAPLCCTDLLPAVTLEEILDLSLAATDVQSLCAGHAANLTLYKQTISQCIEEHRAQGKPLPSNTVVVELDRNPLRTFGGKWGWGKIPSLRTTGPPLFLLSCEDLSRPWQVMRLHRWLSIAERCSALGQRASHAALFSRDTHALHAIGNALSPVQLAAVASPLVEAAVNSGVLTAGNRCKACAVELLPHTKPPGTSANRVRKPRAPTEEEAPKTLPRDTSAKPEASAEEEAPKTLPRDTSTKPEASAEEEAPKTLPRDRDTSTKPEASAEEEAPKTLPRDTSTKPEASAEEEAPKTLPRDTSTAGLDGTQDLPRHQPEGSTQDLPRHQPEGSTQDLPRHQSDDLELELERLVDELFSDDDPGMDVDDAAPQSPLVLSEKATHLFECLAKAKASSKNWLSPASKSSKNELLEADLLLLFVHRPEAKKARKSAEALRGSVAKMGPSQRQWGPWKRLARLGNCSGSRYMTPRDWCAREMILKQYSTLEDAMAAYEQRCTDPDVVTKEINGELCLRVNNGGLENVVDRHTVAASVRQRTDLGDGEQLDGFEEEIGPRMKRASDKLQTERLLSEQQGKQAYVPAVAVRRDLEQEKEVAENRAAEFQQQALALKEKADQKRKELKEKQATQLPSLAVAKLSLTNAIHKANASMSELLKRQKATADTLCKDLTNALCMSDVPVKREAEEKTKVLNGKIKDLETAMEESIAEWNTKAGDESLDIEAMVSMEKDLAAYMKEWHLGKHCQAVLDTKQQIKNFREFTSDCKKEVKKRDKLAAKATVRGSNKKAKLDHPNSQENPLPDEIINCATEPEDEMTVPLLLPPTPMEGFTRDVTRHEYYSEQKKWVEQMLLRSSQKYSCAVVTRDNVARPFLQQLDQILPVPLRSVARPSSKELQEIWQLYFYQMAGDSGRLSMSTDWGLPELRICCEGKEIYLGFPVKKLAGNTTAEMLQHLERMRAEEFLTAVERDGWCDMPPWEGSRAAHELFVRSSEPAGT
ncbi:unnamed protein product [Symbiodinium sp. CCMP2592]|nr:unnamed protein product [Symbiodinium sp. CCMP2592]